MFDRSFFAGAVTETRLREWAGDRYFARGAAYFKEGAVVRLRCDHYGIWARVLGTQPYAVRLWRNGRKPGWGCTCPLGVEGEFCKHLVAAGLAFLSGEHVDDRSEATVDLEPVRELLESTTREELLELLMERAAWDEGLAEELLLAARARPTKTVPVSGRPARQESQT